MLEGEDYNFFLRDENLNTDSDSISFFKDNASTYMGVKTIQEGTLADTNNNPIKKKKSPKKNRNKKKGKKTKKKKSSSGSSFSSLSESSSDSYIEKLNESDIKEINNIQTNQDDKNIKINKKNSEKNIKEISTEFFWDEGGNTVYITGSFCDWKEFFLMEEKSKGVFKKTIMLLPGFYQYKFKVDNNWAYSKKQPKFEDNNGNVNNFIDTTQINLETNKNEVEVEIKETTLKEKNKKDNINIKRKSSNSSLGLLNNIEYSTYIPLKGEFNIKPLSLPGLYKTHYILNEKKNKIIKERKFSQIEYVDQTNNSIRSLSNSKYLENNELYVGFQNLYHIHSNHLHSKKIVDSKNTITSIITRYRAKYSTFIYYKGRKIRNNKNKRLSKTVKLDRDLDKEKIGLIVKSHKNIIYK
jgi:5'-AMP-activated protein kinase regulatory beta subunit